MMPKSALPEKMKDLDFWNSTDNASWLMKLKKRIQYVFAAGPRVPSGFWRWREIPITLFCIRGIGKFRTENTNGSETSYSDKKGGSLLSFSYLTCDGKIHNHYLSRIQCWTNFHVSLQWPFLFNIHLIYKRKDVPRYPKYKSDFGIKKMFTIYFGWKRDSDIVYFPTIYVGGNFE